MSSWLSSICEFQVLFTTLLSCFLCHPTASDSLPHFTQKSKCTHLHFWFGTNIYALFFTYCSCLQLLLLCETVWFVLSHWKCSVRLSPGDCLGNWGESHFCALHTMFWAITHPCELLSSKFFQRPRWMWADSIVLYASEFIQILPSAIKSSTANDPVPLVCPR